MNGTFYLEIVHVGQVEGIFGKQGQSSLQRSNGNGEMIKAIGAVMVILAGSGWGMLQAAKIEECYRQMRYLRKLFFRIRSEIRYSRRVLPEAFLSVGSEAQEPYKMWLLSLYERLENRQGTSLAGIWEEETRTHLPVIGIPQDMLESLIRLGGELGTIDIEMQVRTLDLYLEQMEQKMEDMRTEQKEKIRLYQCIGVTGGVFLAIILL